MVKKKRQGPVLAVKIIVMPVLVAVAVFGIRVLLQPLYLQRLESESTTPLLEYTEAVKRFAALQNAYDTVSFNPCCSPQLLTHTMRTEKVYILIHDYTNCPCQFGRFAGLIFNNNSNVIIFPLPGHGLKDRMADAHSGITAEDLVRKVDRVLDIGSGLGKKMVVLGVSAGAVLAAWAGQTRRDVEKVILITPAFNYRVISRSNRTLTVKLLLSLPNRYRWYDQVLKEEGMPAHVYPRYATRAIAHIVRIGMFLEKMLELQAPLAKSFVVITNGNDSLADNRVTERYVDHLKKYRVEMMTYEFPARMNLGTDIIDPFRTEEQIEKVYPQIMKIIDRQ